jgi:hypothetical protein
MPIILSIIGVKTLSVRNITNRQFSLILLMLILFLSFFLVYQHIMLAERLDALEYYHSLEQADIANWIWLGPEGFRYIDIVIKNTGQVNFRVTDILINDTHVFYDAISPYEEEDPLLIPINSTKTFTVSFQWERQTSTKKFGYTITMITHSGRMYEALANPPFTS